MSTQTSKFMERIRERAAQVEQQANQRLKEIQEHTLHGPSGKSHSTQTTPDWLEASPDEPVSSRKGSLIHLIRGEIRTKSPGQR